MTEEEFKMLEAIRNVKYVNAMNQALKDGKITEEEKLILDAVKKSSGSRRHDKPIDTV
jgi:hypothetical protein